MRNSKHTPEYLEMAKEQSGFENPTPDQLDEWTKLHEEINKDFADHAAKQLNLRCLSLQRIIMPLLSPRAQKIASSAGNTTVLELQKNKKSGACFPWHQSGLTGYDYITPEALEGLELERTFVLTRFMNKVIEVDRGDNKKLDYYIRRFAATFNRLIAHNKVQYGLLGPFVAYTLADPIENIRVGEERKRTGELYGGFPSQQKINEISMHVKEERTTHRLMLLVYPYSHLENKELNKWLGNPVFVEEGGLGTTDWTGLPEVD